VYQLTLLDLGYMASASVAVRHTPQLNCTVGLEEGEYKLSLCYSIVYYCNGAQRYEHAVLTGQSTVLGFDLA